MTIHIPVMADEVLAIYESLPDANGSALFIDATLGAGGHAARVLEKFTASRLIGFDRDAQARELAAERLFVYDGRFEIVPRNFSEIGSLSEDEGFRGGCGVLFDLGVSNMQIATPERGFSFQSDGPLDMRMNADGERPTARELINTLSTEELSRIFREYGEERYAWRIAKGISAGIKNGEPMETTFDLVAMIRRILPAPVQRKMGTHPARRVFQALRIAVNSELEEISAGLNGALSVGGGVCAIIVISYHSLEDRIVKRRFLEWEKEGQGMVYTKHPIVPRESETEINRSARSAKLRAFIKGQAARKSKYKYYDREE
ncbi:ribosomal RNA small subunit methyltransferase H [Synergistales bacterium]|nr:ribosomal RNA small subunit methyltransferase H [Synergistales bacterium]